MRRGRERGGHIAIADFEDRGFVVGRAQMRQRRALLHRIAAIARRRQGLVVHRHQGSGIFRKMARLRHHQCDGLADIADLVSRQRELRARDLGIGIGHQHGQARGLHRLRHVGGREHGMDAREPKRGRRHPRPSPAHGRSSRARTRHAACWGGLMSSTNSPFPVRRRASSVRSTRAPMDFPLIARPPKPRAASAFTRNAIPLYILRQAPDGRNHPPKAKPKAAATK